MGSYKKNHSQLMFLARGKRKTRQHTNEVDKIQGLLNDGERMKNSWSFVSNSFNNFTNSVRRYYSPAPKTSTAFLIPEMTPVYPQLFKRRLNGVPVVIAKETFPPKNCFSLC